MTSVKNQRRGRRHPLAGVALLVLGLFVTGGAYSATSAGIASAQEAPIPSANLVQDGERLFLANCASCHGTNSAGTEAGPSLIGVGAISVEFQVGTGRMPMAASGPQAEKKPVQFTQPQIDAMGAYIHTLGPGPTLPDPRYYAGDGDVAVGAELFRINCAMCHNVAGAGGALTEGKWAPAVVNVDPLHVYAAMVSGPQNMPVFSDMNLSPEDKNNVISYLQYVENNPSVGGFSLGSIGPVAEGLFVWIIGLGVLIAITIWLTAKAH